MRRRVLHDIGAHYKINYVLCITYYVLCIMYYVLCIINAARQSKMHMTVRYFINQIIDHHVNFPGAFL